MKVPVSWLRQYVDIELPVEELAHRITMAGTEVGEIITIGGWKNCYVGYVTKVEPHPNADRLRLCTVEIGGEQMRVVCGAPNVAEKQKIAFAKAGAELFNTHSEKVETLKAAKIRGVESRGMICSELELGTGEDHQGIIVLPDDAPVGIPLSDYLGDQVLDLDVTPNRPDCYSVLGLAHEVAALTDAPLKEPDASYPEDGEPIETQTSMEIADPDLCPRYTASLVTGVKVGPSPKWMQDRLLKAGMRPINNVVDITNYVMLEYGQPLHAFDFDTLKGHRIIVRRARPGEVLVSLDGQERKLTESMLVIADAEDAVALGGLMGAAHTEMTEGTTRVLLESANFNPINNRKTAQALRISTEASVRFEKSLRVALPPIALRRATSLIHDIAGGTVASGIIDVFPGKDQYKTPKVVLTLSRLEKVLGVSFSMEQVKRVLASLGFTYETAGENSLTVEVPYWRSDVNIEDDLVEEVARIVGYEEVPTTTISTPIPHCNPQPLHDLREQVKELLVGCGLQEVISYPVSSLDDMQKARTFENGNNPLKIANPMSAQQEYMRTTLRGSLLSTMATNRSHEHGPIKIFESGRVYLARDRGQLPLEKERVAGVLSGPIDEAHWLAHKGDLGFYDAKGIMESLFQELGVSVLYEPVEDPTMHPGRCAGILADDTRLGIVGEVHPAVLESFEIEAGPVALFDLDVESLLEALPEVGKRYESIGRFPAATRDLSILVGQNISVAGIQDLINQDRLVTKTSLFDVYSGKNTPEGKRSLAFHICFQSPDRTLKAEEVDRSLQSIIGTLEKEVGAELRS